MKTDIQTREDIELLVNQFYLKVRSDDTLNYIFDDIAKLDWEAHLPQMYSFWETILLGKSSFKGNPMMKHIQLDRVFPLQKAHFNRWLYLWELTLTENFNGSKADEALLRAEAIAATMQYKIKTINR